MTEKSRIRLKLVLAYDGSAFHGWQRQKKDRSVQGCLEELFSTLYNEPIQVTGAGRTDSGVHAWGQVAHVDVPDMIPVERLLSIVRKRLVPEIRCRSLEQVSMDFHARFDAKEREYRYYVPREHFGERNIQLLNAYAQKLIGRHDFTGLCAQGDPSPSKVKDIFAASWFVDSQGLVFRIVGISFLWRMVRTIVGTMLDLEAQGADPECMEDILRSADYRKAGTPAVGSYLYLHRVSYESRN